MMMIMKMILMMIMIIMVMIVVIGYSPIIIELMLFVWLSVYLCVIPTPLFLGAPSPNFHRTFRGPGSVSKGVHFFAIVAELEQGRIRRVSRWRHLLHW